MFGFRQFFGKEDKGKSSRQNQMQVGVQLLGSLLVCYPEIASVTYDPKRDNLELAFMVRQPLPPGKGADEFADFLQESLEAYHDLEAGYNAWSSVEAEEQGDKLFHERPPFSVGRAQGVSLRKNNDNNFNTDIFVIQQKHCLGRVMQ